MLRQVLYRGRYEIVPAAQAMHFDQINSTAQRAGEVWVSPEECKTLAARLEIPVHRFLPAYTKSYTNKQGWRMLRSKGDNAVSRVLLLVSSSLHADCRRMQACIFLGADNLCTVHESRPLQCGPSAKAQW